jgi:hypothetical protein
VAGRAHASCLATLPPDIWRSHPADKQRVAIAAPAVRPRLLLADELTGQSRRAITTLRRCADLVAATGCAFLMRRTANDWRRDCNAARLEAGLDGAMRVALTLAALISHRAPTAGEPATLVLGLAIATALWSGVQALNAQARNSYDAAAAAISGGGARTLVAARGGLFDQELFVRLRRAGVTVSPVLEGAVRIGERNIRIIGVEPVSLPRRSPIAHMRTRADVLEEFFTGPGRSSAPQTLRRLDLAERLQPRTERVAAPPLFCGAPGRPAHHRRHQRRSACSIDPKTRVSSSPTRTRSTRRGCASAGDALRLSRRTMIAICSPGRQFSLSHCLRLSALG